MKKLLSLLAMAMMAVDVSAQAVIAEVDWTQESEYYHDLGWLPLNVTASVTKEGLVIQSTPPDGANIWEANIPILAHIDGLKGNGRYQAKLTVDSPADGELQLDLTDGMPASTMIDVKKGLHEYTIDFPNLPGWLNDAFLLYQCGHLPGIHIIKKVQIIDLDADLIDDIIYNYYETNKTAEVKGVSKNIIGKIVIPETVIHNGEEYTVTSIDKCAFMMCSELVSVDIPNSVTHIGNDAFSYCGSLVSLNLPNNLTRINSGAFACCTSLVSLNIPSSVTYIENNAFAGCNNLVSVNFLSSLTRIGEFLFYGCSSLSEVKINISDYTAFCNNTIVSQLMKEDFSHPITLLDINGKEIKEFTIPDGVTSIGSGAFYNCSGLASIVIPNSVTSIGECAFKGCKKLTSLTLPEDLSVIKRQAFYGCSSLESITIPASVEYIFQEAFAGCQNLKQVNVLSENPPFLSDNSFSNYDITLCVPEVSKDKYLGTEPWNKFTAIKTLTGEDLVKEKCVKPTISYQNGKLIFYCETDGAVCQSTITDTDITSYSSNEVQLEVTYHISVYATKAGYENSETTTATLCWIDVEPKMEGTTDEVVNVRARAVLIQSNGNQLIISGVDEGTAISVFDIAGRPVGSTTSSTEATTINTSLRSGDICIVKIGDKAVKVLMK
ncbi:MAG: leucine-rich repeat domain-containing protein [Prevotella sp.]|nr:leucine-rich repeat domain-containing protein [Prevotella sp.]